MLGARDPCPGLAKRPRQSHRWAGGLVRVRSTGPTAVGLGFVLTAVGGDTALW